MVEVKVQYKMPLGHYSGSVCLNSKTVFHPIRVGRVHCFTGNRISFFVNVCCLCATARR